LGLEKNFFRTYPLIPRNGPNYLPETYVFSLFTHFPYLPYLPFILFYIKQSNHIGFLQLINFALNVEI